MAKGYAAVHTSGRLILPFIIGEPDFYLAVVIDPFLYRPVPRNLSPYF
jgi:hypothetical protein